MSETIRFETVTYPSSDGKSTIHGYIWMPENPRGIIQLSHGMCEYIQRYDAWARRFAAAGFVFAGNDHPGHGQSAPDKESLGYTAPRDGAELICLGTNDSWFSDSAALYMHNAQAQLRAIENGRYVVRAANTGISTVINSRGEVIAELEPLVSGNAYATVYASSAKSLNTNLGNLFVYLVIVGMFVLFLCDIVKKVKININKS